MEVVQESKRTKSYVIELSPIPWQRAGLCGTKFYDNQVRDKTYCGLMLQKQHGNEPPFSKALYIDINFFIKPSKVKKRDLTFHAIKPDIDNLLKFILDTLVKAEIIADDKIICQLTTQKKWDINPRTEITIMELE